MHTYKIIRNYFKSLPKAGYTHWPNISGGAGAFAVIQRHHLALVRSLRTSVGRREWVRGLTVITENKERSIFDLMLVDWEEYDSDAADRQMNYEEQEYLKSIEQFNRDKEG